MVSPIESPRHAKAVLGNKVAVLVAKLRKRYPALAQAIDDLPESAYDSAETVLDALADIDLPSHAIPNQVGVLASTVGITGEYARVVALAEEGEETGSDGDGDSDNDGTGTGDGDGTGDGNPSGSPSAED
jgi:hypothetical protein